MSADALRIEGLVAGYVPDVNILGGVDLRVGSGEIVAIVGPNGAGKSTLVKSVLGVLRPRAGRVLLHDTDVSGKAPHKIVHMGLGYVAQRKNVFPSLTVEENLRVGGINRPGLDVDARIGAVMELFPRLADRRRVRAGTLSGGERQMLAMARTLIPEPKVLLLDEPSAALSPIFVDVIFGKIEEINDAGASILLVEQNAKRALALCDRGYVLELGRNRFEGRGSDLLDDPHVAELYLGGSTLPPDR